MADEAQGGEADGGCHAADLTVLAFVDLQFNPRGRDFGAVPDGVRAFPRRSVSRYSQLIEENDMLFTLDQHGSCL